MKKQFLAVLAVSIFLNPMVSVASGSISLSSGGHHQLYNLGKKVFHQKLACESCDLSKMMTEIDSTNELLEKIQAQDVFKNLETKEQKAVVAYVKKRYSK